MDVFAAMEKGFEEELSRLLDAHPVVRDELVRLSEEASLELGRETARTLLAPLIWSAAAGERWDVSRVCAFLGISRQALYKRVRNGSALGKIGRAHV